MSWQIIRLASSNYFLKTSTIVIHVAQDPRKTTCFIFSKLPARGLILHVSIQDLEARETFTSQPCCRDIDIEMPKIRDGNVTNLDVIPGSAALNHILQHSHCADFTLIAHREKTLIIRLVPKDVIPFQGWDDQSVNSLTWELKFAAVQGMHA